jgi:hypothetical protein
VGPLPPQQCEWVIRPLLDAGLDLDRITDLVVRVGFEAVVGEGAPAAVPVSTLVDDQPAPVRAAWTEVVHRMISLHRPDGG